MSHVVWKSILQFYYFSTEFLVYFVDISTIYKGGEYLKQWWTSLALVALAPTKSVGIRERDNLRNRMPVHLGERRYVS